MSDAFVHQSIDKGGGVGALGRDSIRRRSPGAATSPRIVTTGGNAFPSAQTGEFCPANGLNPSEVDCRTCKFRHGPWCLLDGEAA